MEHIIAYAHEEPGEPLRQAGASQVFLDSGKSRKQRAAMVAWIENPLRVRRGEAVKVMVYSLRNLSGSYKTDQRWRDDLAGMGATLEIVEKPAKPNGKPGPKSEYETRADHWDIWHKSPKGWSDFDCLEQMQRDYPDGPTLTRNIANGRYGHRGAPKERPEATDAAR